MKCTHIFDYIGICAAGKRLTEVIIKAAVPFEIPVAGRVYQFTPSVVNENLKIIRDEETEYIKVLVF